MIVSEKNHYALDPQQAELLSDAIEETFTGGIGKMFMGELRTRMAKEFSTSVLLKFVEKSEKQTREDDIEYLREKLRNGDPVDGIPHHSVHPDGLKHSKDFVEAILDNGDMRKIASIRLVRSYLRWIATGYMPSPDSEAGKFLAGRRIVRR